MARLRRGGLRRAVLQLARATRPIGQGDDGGRSTAGDPREARALGFDVIQVYGLTETFGHVVQCGWRDEWDRLPFAEQAEIKARQASACR
jgi:hypothetical protein